ncbi:transcriptional repressor LexA [Haloimpatiens lingqiaonensis]|uniref:transcriptional repressor LexA n=1 Tax=Haloimpatiens lingqiaonensis TaxID=1380675 RepID=UPI0010FF609B|nr:transcriptional repressor LexA [Haloimpatiens lingqiaonensis]
MRIGSIYDKFIKWKNNKITLLSAKESEEKNLSLIKRLLYIKNNYCFSQKDEILFTAVKDKNLEDIKYFYENMENSNKHSYDTLLTSLSKEPTVSKIDALAEEYFIKYKVRNNLKLQILKDENIEIEILEKCINKVKENYKRIKIFKEDKVQLILSEIRWIKNLNYEDLDSYQKAPKHNGLRKSSKAREGIFLVKNLYEKEMDKLFYVSYEDMLVYAAKEADLNPRFVHILVDGCERLTYLQWNFLKALLKGETYSSLTLAFNIENGESVYCPFMKNGRLYTSVFQEKVKKFNLKNKKHMDKMQDAEQQCGKIKNIDALEKFQYFDLRHKTNVTMMKDYSSSDEIVVNHEEEVLEYSKDEVTKIPVFTNIAAGEPIYIDPSLEGNFSIPKQWMKGLKDCFILKVKGDSMINANINDGDFVVIHKQMDVNNNDIVAANISGSATLKRLSISKKGVFLNPENKKYSPIPVNEEGIFILGKAVGIIRRI